MHFHKKIVDTYFESHSNTTNDSPSSHLYPNVMIYELKKVGSHYIYSYRTEKILYLNFSCLFLPKKSKILYNGHFFQEPKVSAIDRFDCSLSTYAFSKSQFKLLNENLNFCLKPDYISKTEKYNDIQELEGKIELKLETAVCRCFSE